MPVELLSAAERDRLSRFPRQIARTDLAAFFTLSERDRLAIGKLRGEHSRLGFALQLSALRFLGFVPAKLAAAPEVAVRCLAKQLCVDSSALARYGARPKTIREHLPLALAHLGFRRVTPFDLDELECWLIERALEHDRPSLLIEDACGKLRRERLLRPGITVVERAVAAARTLAHEETFRRMAPTLTPQVITMLDGLLIPEKEGQMTTLGWLRRHATANTPGALIDVLAKIGWLRERDVHNWDLSAIRPNRLKLLARLGRRYTNQALQRATPERRYPILVAFLRHTLLDTVDEAIDVFNACLAGVFARTKRALRENDEAVARSAEEKVRLFHRLGRLVLDTAVHDIDLRTAIFRRIPPLELAAAVDEARAIIHPEGRAFFDFLDRRHSYVRQFAPAFLQRMTLCSNQHEDPILGAVELLRGLNQGHRRKLPEHVPTSFVESRWRPYVFENGKPQGAVNRHGWEFCVLATLRDHLRSGDVFAEPSNRYADPESYLIARKEWPRLRAEACELLGLTETGRERLAERVSEAAPLLQELDRLLLKARCNPSENGTVGDLRLEGGDLIVPAFEAEEQPPSVNALEEEISRRLPRLDLPDLLIEVDTWTGFSRHLTHGAGVTARVSGRAADHLKYLYAIVLAQGCNMTLTEMAQSADLSYDRLYWTTTWYLREETLSAAVDELVNFQYRQTLASLWGGGTLSSSDGQRFPVRGRVRNAAALPRYFGYGRGITFYTWTSDQYSQYGTKVISSTVRDATYILDEILDNETDLTILEHTSDHAGYTDLVFALFDLLGMRFSPRLRDLGDTKLYRIRGDLLDNFTHYPNLTGLFTGTVNLDRIEREWDELLRVSASLKLGYTTASLLISKLQARPRQNRLTRLLQEYGRLVKTLHVLRCLENTAYRRRIGTQLNKGEQLHQLRSWLTFGGDGKIRRKQEEAQTEQARCLNLVANAVVVWNTIYIQAITETLRTEGYNVRDQDLLHISPARFEHINRYGKYHFNVDGAARAALRPLRKSKDAL